MDKEHIKMAILRQEQMFRQQVHELHHVYRVQKQLMREMQIAEANRAQSGMNTKTRLKVEILQNESATDRRQCESYSEDKKPPSLEDFDLELTLATGSCRSHRRKQEKCSNSDSGATASSSSTESELGRFHKTDITLSFQDKSKRRDELGRFHKTESELMQSPWLYQCLSLKMA